MAYNNNNNNNRPNMQKKRPNWFDVQIQNLGPDFIIKLKPEEITRECRVIFRDLIRGNIDVIKYHQYLSHPDIVTPMYNEAHRKYNEYNIIGTSMDYYVHALNNTPGMVREQLTQVIQVQQTIGAKRTVYGQLMMAIDKVRVTMDVPSAYIPLNAMIGKYAYILD